MPALLPGSGPEGRPLSVCAPHAGSEGVAFIPQVPRLVLLLPTAGQTEGPAQPWPGTHWLFPGQITQPLRLAACLQIKIIRRTADRFCKEQMS